MSGIYKGRAVSWNNQIAKFDKGKIYSGSSSNQIGFIEGNKIYKGKYSKREDHIIGIIEGDYIYSGKSISKGLGTKSPVATIDNKGNIYEGRGKSKQVACTDGGRLSACAGAAFLYLM